MEMHQIKYFLAVSRTLNFSRAAEQCNVSQPALTRAIQQLEEELGGLLLRRERKDTHLTDLGQLMVPHLTRILEEAEAARTTARGILRLENAELTVGVMCTIGPLRFAGFLAWLRQSSPGLRLNLREGTPLQLTDLLQKGELDIALMAQPEPYPERFVVRPLYRECFVIAFPTGHRFEARNAIPMADAAGESYLLRINCEFKDAIADLCQQQGFQNDKVYRSEREDWIQAMVAAGMGICFMPEYSPVIPGVVTRPVLDPPIEREVALVHVAGRRFSSALTAFIKGAQTYAWPKTQ